MWLVAGGWVTYTVVATLTLPTAIVHWLASATFAAVAITTIVAIRGQRDRTEQAVRRLHTEGPAL